MSQVLLNTEWAAVTTAGQSCSVWLDQQDDGASGAMDVRVIGAYSTPSADDFTKARRVFRPIDNETGLIFNCPNGMILYAKCKDGTATITVDSSVGINPIFQTSYTKDGLLTTTYADDYVTRGKGFELQRRITLTSGQTLYLEFNIALAVGKLVYSLPIRASTNIGTVFLDTYLADSSTGGTAMSVNNLNGLSSTVPLTTVKTGVTPSGTPTKLREYSIGAAKTNQSSGGGTGSAVFPKVLDNTKPLYFKFVNQETVTVTVDLGFVWYEI